MGDSKSPALPLGDRATVVLAMTFMNGEFFRSRITHFVRFRDAVSAASLRRFAPCLARIQRRLATGQRSIGIVNVEIPHLARSC